jgi:3-hydroxyisobutyrate dehydrogenase-like beta-hydroxyacid dehydrogenase
MGDTVPSRPTVGFIGTGAMGLPMAHNLLRAGFPLVVHTRTAARAAPLVAAGATVAPSVAALAAQCDVIASCLNTVEASEAVFLGPEGVAAHARPGTLWVDHATITPALALRLGAEAEARGAAFLDAPVSGGPEGAAKGTLAIMVGGSAEAFARARPVLEAMGQVVRHLGPVGSGTHAKLVNQLLTFVHGMAAAEAIALAEGLGVELGALAEVLRASFGHSRMLDRTLARVQAGDYAAGATLQLYTKDLGITQEAGAAHGIALPVLAHAAAFLREAIAEGLGAQDIAALRLRYPAAPDFRLSE